MRLGTLAGAGAMAILLGCAPAAAAERSKFTPGQAAILAAGSLVNEASGTQFRMGQDLMVTIQSNAAARARAGKVVGVRVFPLGPGERRPHPWASFDPCNVYFARLFGARASGHRINLGNLKSIDFLTVVPSGIDKGRFLLIFEAGNYGAGAMFRINKTDEQAYFAAGLYIEVLPTRRYGVDEVSGQRNRVGNRSASLNAEARQNHAGLRCYRIRTVSADGSASDEMAYAGDCRDAVEPTSS
jgi:hypothetical protein